MKNVKNILYEILKDYDLKTFEDSQRFKAVFADYAKGEYKSEGELLLKIIESGVPNEIKNAENLPIVIKFYAKKMHEKHFFDEKVCSDFIELFADILRKDNKSQKSEEIENEPVPNEQVINKNNFDNSIKCKQCGKNIDSQFIFCPYCGSKVVQKTIIKNKKVEDKVFRNNDIWLCGKCGCKNNLQIDFCKHCGKEFWPEG